MTSTTDDSLLSMFKHISESIERLAKQSEQRAEAMQRSINELQTQLLPSPDPDYETRLQVLQRLASIAERQAQTWEDLGPDGQARWINAAEVSKLSAAHAPEVPERIVSAPTRDSAGLTGVLGAVQWRVAAHGEAVGSGLDTWPFSKHESGLLIFRRSTETLLQRISMILNRFRESAPHDKLGVVITGTRGLGKTRILDQALFTWLNDRSLTAMLLHDTAHNTKKYLQRNATGTWGATNVPAGHCVLSQMLRKHGYAGCLYICDASEPHTHADIFDGITIVSASLNRAHFAAQSVSGQFYKFYVQPWSENELYVAALLQAFAPCSSVCADEFNAAFYTRVHDKQAMVKERVGEVSGVFRHIFTGTLDMWRGQQDDALADTSLSSLAKVSSEQHFPGDLSHRLVVLWPTSYKADGSSEENHDPAAREMVIARWVSRRVRKELHKRHLDATDWRSVESALLGAPQEMYSASWGLWQDKVFEWFIKNVPLLPTEAASEPCTRSLLCRKLLPRLGGASSELMTFAISYHGTVTIDLTHGLQIQPEAVRDQLYAGHPVLLRPLSKRFPVCDAILTQGTGTSRVVYLLQATLQSKRKICGWKDFAGKILAGLGDVWKDAPVSLMFIVPHARCDQYSRPQPFYDGNKLVDTDVPDWTQYVGCVREVPSVSSNTTPSTSQGTSPTQPGRAAATLNLTDALLRASV